MLVFVVVKVQCPYIHFRYVHKDGKELYCWYAYQI